MIPNDEIIERIGVLGIHTIDGHVLRTNVECLPRRLFYADVTTGARRQGGQKRRCKNILKTSLRHLSINTKTWEYVVQNRQVSRTAIDSRAFVFKAK